MFALVLRVCSKHRDLRAPPVESRRRRRRGHHVIVVERERRRAQRKSVVGQIAVAGDGGRGCHISVSGRITTTAGDTGSSSCCRRRRRNRHTVKLPRVRIIAWMLEFAVRAQIVAACVRRPTQRALESSREMHVIVVPDVRHYFAAQFTPVQVTSAWQLVERKPHVPGF